MKHILTGLFVWLATTGAVLAASEFEGVRLWAAPDHTRVVFDTSGPVSHELFPLTNPNRLVIDVEAAVVAKTLETATAAGGLVKGIRTAINKPGMLRIVLDLKQAVKPRSFNLSPNDRYGHRLVVDLY
ncbi:MAG: AMIN domain-containing protein [Gammaproteobacteria bacterium]